MISDLVIRGKGKGHQRVSEWGHCVNEVLYLWELDEIKIFIEYSLTMPQEMVLQRSEVH